MQTSAREEPSMTGATLVIRTITAIIPATVATILITAVSLAAQDSTAAVPRSHPFQQGVRYRIEAFEDDGSDVLRGRAKLTYTNHAPTALERLYFHQYLNAFRPNSAWAAYDLEHGDREYQDLAPADQGFERLSGFTVDGKAVAAVYPGSPDSTVFYVELPQPLEPGDSLVAEMDWTARLSTHPRRQGRKGRHYDWAHWYPRIAVYGPGGWEYRAHIRPGELNGNFATYDVTMDLPEDQVVGATGLPLEGDPGWAAVAVQGSEPPRYLRDFYDTGPADSLGLLKGAAASGRKRIRWHAEKVHNFAWSTSPDYVYMGGRWNGRPINLLWEPSNTRWDPERTMAQEKAALDWIVTVVGEYPWPQMTITDRIERGATEFEMLFMTSGGAITHETMHMIFHGVLANNEWREGWLDEGMASFLSDWLAVRNGADPDRVWGRTMTEIARLDAAGRGEPVGLPGAEFSSYPMYSMMTYEKGAAVLRMLRYVLGEDTFLRAMHEYYDRFRFRQVTGQDFENVMESVSGRDLDWFFDEWIRKTELLDYAVGDVSVSGGPGAYTVTAEIIREGEAWMPVVVEAGGKRERVESSDRVQHVTFRLDRKPDAVLLDPDHVLLENDRADDSKPVR